MKLNDTEMVNAIIAPVIGHAFPQGEDVRYDSDFEMVETELAKLTSVYKDHKTDWKLVLQLSYELLTTRSKDLRIVCWYAYAQLKVNGLVRLPAVLFMLQKVIEQYWEQCFPVKIRARLAALIWLFDRIDYNENKYAENLSSDELNLLILSLESCDEILNGKFDGKVSFLQPKLQLLRDIRRRQNMSKIEPVLANPVSTNHTPVIDVLVPVPGTITEDNDSIRIARYIQEQSRLLTIWFLSKDLADPRAYLLTRSSAWLQVVSAPLADAQGLTKLKPLTANKLQEYQQKLSAKEFAVLIPELEVSLSKAPFWLDGHHWCAQALDGLGHHQMANHLRDYLCSFLSKHPSLLELSFDDGSPFASETTKLWLSTASSEQMTNCEVFNNSADEQQPWLMALAMAQENINHDISCLKQEIRSLHTLANTAASGRDKTMWLLALAKLCQQYQRHDLAVFILEDIHQYIYQFRLNQWEPLLEKKVLQQLLLSLEKVNAKQHQEKIKEIKTNLYRMDISIAF